MPQRRFQFSMRSIIVTLVVTSAVLAWLGWHLRARREKAFAFTQMNQLGTLSAWNYDANSRQIGAVTLAPSHTSPRPEHLRALQSLNGLKLIGDKVTDSWLRRLRIDHVGTLRFLDLSETRVTDTGLECLRHMPNLRDLNLSNTAVTNAGLRHIRTLDYLSSLQLDGTQVTDDGLKELVKLEHLGGLGLTNTRVTDSGVDRFRMARPQNVNLNVSFGPYPRNKDGSL